MRFLIRDRCEQSPFDARRLLRGLKQFPIHREHLPYPVLKRLRGRPIDALRVTVIAVDEPRDRSVFPRIDEESLDLFVQRGVGPRYPPAQLARRSDGKRDIEVEIHVAQIRQRVSVHHAVARRARRHRFGDLARRGGGNELRGRAAFLRRRRRELSDRMILRDEDDLLVDVAPTGRQRVVDAIDEHRLHDLIDRTRSQRTRRRHATGAHRDHVDLTVLGSAQGGIVVVEEFQLERDVERIRQALQQVVLNPGGVAPGIEEIGVWPGNDGRNQRPKHDRIDATRQRWITAAGGEQRAYADDADDADDADQGEQPAKRLPRACRDARHTRCCSHRGDAVRGADHPGRCARGLHRR